MLAFRLKRGDLRVNPEGTCPAWSGAATVNDRTLLVQADEGAHTIPAEVRTDSDWSRRKVLYDGDELLRLTYHNPWLADVDPGRQEVVRWAARDDVVDGVDFPVPRGPASFSGPLASCRRNEVRRFDDMNSTWYSRF